MHSAATATRDPTPPFREFLYHAAAEQRSALRIFAAILATAILIAALLHPRYRATATLAILPAPEFTVRAAAGSHDLNMSSLALDQIMKAETGILESDDLHLATLRRQGPPAIYPDVFDTTPRSLFRQVVHGIAAVVLAPWRVTPPDPQAARMETALKLFSKDLDVLPAKDANVITLSFDHRDRVQAAETLNSLLTLYAERRRHLYTDPQVEIVRRNVDIARQAVATADASLAAFKQSHDISDYEQERGLLLHRRSEADQALADARVAEHETQARLEALSARLRAEPTNVGLYREQDADTRLLAVNAGIADLRAKLAAAREKYRDTSRTVTGLRAQIAASEAEAQRLTRDSTASVVREGRNPAIDPLRLDQTRALADSAAAAARRAAMETQSRDIADKVERLDRDEVALAALQRQKTSAEADFTENSRLLAERSLSEAEDARRLANVRIIQPAMVPQKPRPIPLLIVAAGFMLAILAASGWIVAVFMMRPVFLTGEGLSAATHLPVLAVFTKPARQEAALL
jgi:uncharacterized protein involved in exopolysaccharide biosynthesis